MLLKDNQININENTKQGCETDFWLMQDLFVSFVFKFLNFCLYSLMIRLKIEIFFNSNTVTHKRFCTASLKQLLTSKHCNYK